jgi:hypothetical protein
MVLEKVRKKMNCSTLNKLVLATALVIGFGINTAHAKPVVIGDPAKGTPITTLQEGKDKVEITTTGITLTDGDEDQDDDKDEVAAVTTSIGNHGKRVFVSSGEEWEDTLVPVAFFLFLLTVILGTKYISSRNEQRRLELLKMMVEKGQAVPEAVVNQILTPQAAPEDSGSRQSYKRTRNAFGFTLAGAALCLYGLIGHAGSSALIPGLVFLCLGAAGLAGLYLPKRDEKISG